MNIAQAKALVAVEEVIGARVALQRRGNVFVGPCPFHQDSGRPNLVVFPKTQTWQCFACGAQGDVIDFLRKVDNVTVQEVIAMISGHSYKRSVQHLPVPRRKIASADVRNAAYHALIEQEPLMPHHLAALLGRGFTPEEVAAAEYRTHVPGPAPQGLDLEDVPGFYATGSTWLVNGPPGVLIPVRDRVGRIVGCQVRPSESEHGKYMWLSSTNKPQGTSSGAPCHYAAAKGSQLWITEGPLKADFVAACIGHPCLGVAGVTNWKSALLLLGDATDVVLAFDQDPPGATHGAVQALAAALAQQLAQRGIKVRRATWDWHQAKGIDDALRVGTFIDVR